MKSSYLNINIKELVSRAPKHILEIIRSGEIGSTTIKLASEYDIPVGQQTALSNVITYVLLGAVLPEDTVSALVDLVQTDEATAVKIATDLNTSIFQKARNLLLDQEEEVKTLEYAGKKQKTNFVKKSWTLQSVRVVSTKLRQVGPKKRLLFWLQAHAHNSLSNSK
jgi:type III secretion system FlhB-like substrate exporter